MASYNNYYNNFDDEYRQAPVHAASPSPAYNPHSVPSQQSTPAPSYHTSYPPPVAPYPGANPQDRPPRTSPSPFDTVFDDNAYPANSRTDLAPQSSNDMSQNNAGYYQQDTGYHGQQNYGQSQSQNQLPGSSDDIPLQDRHNKYGQGPDPESPAGFNDHIYDAPEQGRTKRKKRRKAHLGQLGMFGADKKRIPFVVYIFTICQVGVFIGELINNSILTGSPIMTKPQFNFMIGPSPYVLVHMGARFPICMHRVKEIEERQGNVMWPCPEATDWNDQDQLCELYELCGFGAKESDNPDFDGVEGNGPWLNQWWRFIVPMFLHAGVIHIAFNMLLQLTLARDMEMGIGSLRFFIVYVSAGIFGFILGGNFAEPSEPSVGASGSLFGIIALTLLDLFYSWRDRKSPGKDLAFLLVDIVISFVLGLLPGLDNFSHIGGFLVGIALGVSVLHSPNALRLKIGQDVAYTTVAGETDTGTQSFMKSPLGFFKGRKPLWWAWWLIRAGALVLVIVVFIVLINNFYTNSHTCSWCKYLSCIPVYDWCERGEIRFN